MKYFSLLMLSLMAFAACQTSKTTETAETQEAVPVTLTLKWETDTILTTCESVIYDKDNDVLYVSNIEGSASEKDGEGSISKLGLDGNIVDPQWISGLNAPKGLGIAKGKLYAADIDVIVEIDIASGQVTNKYPVEGAKFLNDVTTDAEGRVFVSDSQAGNVVLLENGKVTKWLEGVAGPNGLLSEADQMLIALWDVKTLSVIDLETKAITSKTDNLENPDGIEPIGDGGYLVSSWNGLVHYVSPAWEKTLILDTRADSISAADIEYIQDKNLLLVPTFYKNKVMAYELTTGAADVQ